MVWVGAWHDDFCVDGRVGLGADDAGELLYECIMPTYDVGANTACKCVSSVEVLMSVAVTL